MIVRRLSETGFAPYGHVIREQAGDGELFQVIVREPDAAGWQMAVSRKTGEPVHELGRHPNTREAFAPLSGVSVMIVAPADEPENTEAFLLDQPVCLFRNIWHATAALSEQAVILIVENAEVASQAYRLTAPLQLGIVTLHN